MTIKSPVVYIALAFFAPLIVSGCTNSRDKEKEIFYNEIDREIENVPEYDSQKENRIQNLKSRIRKENSEETKAELTDWLISEYEAYISDSALFYINRNLENPTIKTHPLKRTELLIKKADIAAHAGLFGEATAILEDSISRTNLDSTLLENYYSAFCDLYQYQGEYAVNSEYARNHETLRELYIDSISQVAKPSSINYLAYHAAKEARNGNFTVAESMLQHGLDRYKSGDRNYSILASILADLYQQQGDKENFNRYICLSVISDLKGAVKENMAIRALATQCYEEGDLERADRYLRQSFADANFYSARMRNAQSSRMLPIIGEAYSVQQKGMTRQLTLFIIFISVLALGFIFISIFAFKQVRKVKAVNLKTKGMLEEVSSLSEKLKELNQELSNTNRELLNSNAIKGEYGALFMEYCSLAISSLQQYQQSLKVAAAQGNIKALMKKIESGAQESKFLSEFYAKFDEAVLHIYPNFIDKFNSLLKPEDEIMLKPGETMNTELRLFALIRIGITDPEKIAGFLRCSISTVYTYRSKTKKKAKNPDKFEDEIMLI